MRGVHTLDISLGGSFIAYPLAALDSGEPSHFNLGSISVRDGGLFKYEGLSEQGDAVVISLDGSLTVHGGGQLTGNKISVKGKRLFNLAVGSRLLNYFLKISHIGQTVHVHTWSIALS